MQNLGCVFQTNNIIIQIYLNKKVIFYFKIKQRQPLKTLFILKKKYKIIILYVSISVLLPESLGNYSFAPSVQPSKTISPEVRPL